MSRILVVLVVLPLLLFLLVGSIYREQGMDRERLNNISSELDYFNSDAIEELRTDENNSYIGNVINKAADTLLYIVFGAAKETVEYGYDHPEYNFQLFFWLVIVYLLVPLIFPSILIGYGLYLLIKWFIQKLKGLRRKG